jgi:hypothetical protein
MYLISWEEGGTRLRGALEKTSCNKISPWDPKSNETPLQKIEGPIK